MSTARAMHSSTESTVSGTGSTGWLEVVSTAVMMPADGSGARPPDGFAVPPPRMLPGNRQARSGWTVVTAHVVEYRHDRGFLLLHDLELARRMHRLAVGDHGMRNVLALHKPLRHQQPVAGHDIDHPLPLGNQGVERSAGNLDRHGTNATSCVQLQPQGLRVAVVVRAWQVVLSTSIAVLSSTTLQSIISIEIIRKAEVASRGCFELSQPCATLRRMGFGDGTA